MPENNEHLFDLSQVPVAKRQRTPAAPAKLVETEDAEHTAKEEFLKLGSAQGDISQRRFYEWGTKPTKWVVYPSSMCHERGVRAWSESEQKWMPAPPTKPKWGEYAINDPRRPEWGMFSDIMERPIEVPVKKEHAWMAMKQALLDAYTHSHGKDLVRACAPNQLSSFTKTLNDPDEAMNCLTSRLLAFWPKAEAPNPNKITDPTRGASGYPLHYWDPNMKSAKAYIGDRVGHIICSEIEERAKLPPMLSFDTLAAAGRDFDEDGKMVKTSRESEEGHLDPINPYRDPDAPEDYNKERQTLREASRIPSTLLPEWRRKQDPVVLAGRGRPDYEFFQSMSDSKIKAAKTPEERYAQLKTLANATVDSVKHTIPEDERDSILEDLENWDPSTETFTRMFPDVAESALNMRYQEVVVKPAMPAAKRALTSMDEVPPMEAPASTHKAFAAASSRDAQIFTARAKVQADLDDPGRRADYQFLCEKMGEKVDEHLRGPALHAKVKAMAIEWTGVAMRGQPAAPYFKQVLTKWKPEKDGFMHEVLAEAVAKRRGLVLPQKGQTLLAVEAEVEENNPALPPPPSLAAKPVSIPKQLTRVRDADQIDLLS